MSIESVMSPNHLILCHPLLLLPSIFPSIRIFSNESVLCIRWPKYWSFSFSIGPSNEYSGLISFRMDWLDLLAVQGTLGQKGFTMKKDGLFASILQAAIAEEKKKVATKRPDIAFNQKKQLWYMLMNQIDSEPDDGEESEEVRQ